MTHIKIYRRATSARKDLLSVSLLFSTTKKIHIAGDGKDEGPEVIEIPVWNGTVANLTASRSSFQPSRKMRIWGQEGYAALDFAPTGVSGCGDTGEWATAMASGIVARTGEGEGLKRDWQCNFPRLVNLAGLFYCFPRGIGVEWLARFKHSTI